MEYCALGDLSLFISRRGSLGEHRYTRDMIAKYPNPPGGALNEVIVRHFLKQLASSLKFLRDRNLIHRDIKPQNLLLCPSPASFRSGVAQFLPFKGSENSYDPETGLQSLPMLKIADFGFARSLPSTSLAETLCGSPLYMAPEILRYEKYDAKADLWSVGTVLFEMVVGRPPFRASNHVELLRRIEKGEDKIKIPETNPTSDEVKNLIRVLLKRNPVERMTFRDFFESRVIQGEIPGLVGDDRPSRPRHQPADTEPRKGLSQEETPLSVNPRLETQRRASGTPPSTGTMRRTGSSDRPQSATKEAPRITYPNQRPSPVPSPTVTERQRDRNATGLPPTDNKQTIKLTQNEQDRAAQDVAFERDYVLVEKRAVEVNAFADELAHSPRLQSGFSRPGQPAVVNRRTSPQNVPTSSAASPQPNAAKAIQVAAGRARNDSMHRRQNSYERRYGQSPTSATSALSKALNMASGRLFGTNFSPPLTLAKGGRSPPVGYNPFPAYPTQGNMVVLADGTKAHVPLDEDTKAVQVIEECATRSDVVYGFAEVKYKQLIPLAPSAPADSPLKPNQPSPSDNDGTSSDAADAGLTVDAIVTLSEEALVLYVKALSLLAKSMDIAGAWWARKNRGENISESTSNRNSDATGGIVGTRINNVVQWVRNRFNEVLEKAEFVRLKLLEAQKRLSLDHPSHPSNHAVTSTSAGTPVDVVVSAGVTAEKLMYDRALEMSRAAAINELTSEDLPGCEIAYVTAIRMLEAVLEEEEDPATAQAALKKGEKAMPEGVQVEDRKVILKRKCCATASFSFPPFLSFSYFP